MVLLVVDTQKGCFNDSLYLFDTVRKNIKHLISLARENNVEVLYVQHDDGPGTDLDKTADNYEIYEEFAPINGEKRFEKNVNSAFHPMTGLTEYLNSKGEKNIITIGVSIDYCMDATVKSGFEEGFNIYIPAYTNSTYDNPYFDKETTYKYFNEFMWPKRYATCISFDEAVKMIKNNHSSEASKAGESDNEIDTDTGILVKGIAPCGTQEIETERLILRQFKYEDAESMRKNWAGLDEVQSKYGEPSYKTPEAVKGLLDEYIGAYKNGFKYRWAVIEKESGECIGQVAYFLVDINNNFGEIEYCIGTAFQGKGYATEATKAVIDYGFNKIHFHKVQICVRPSNLSSKRVIEKCDFEYEGTLRDYFLINGEYEGRMYYSIIKK